jgi:glutamate/tyrosine decarboxylase-like PLP-dependent enzyme
VRAGDNDVRESDPAAVDRLGDALRELIPALEQAAGAGVFTSGGSTANLIALGAARQAAFERVGVDVAEDGVPSGARTRIYASTRAHRTVHRAAARRG